MPASALPAAPPADSPRRSARRSNRAGAAAAIGRIDAVDGARGLAIASVLLYHSGWSTRGLFGVDVFFVISGFLITLLLMKEAHANGRIRLGRFYARRAKRLLPGLFLILTAVLLVVWSMGSLRELRSAAATAIASVLQVANWQQIGSDAAYWEAAGAIVPLGQMWSLSVTEQFYIAWPLIVGGLWFTCGRRQGAFTALLFVLLAAAAAVAPLLFDGANTDRLYLGTDSRAVAFVAGAAFAAATVWVRTRGPAWAAQDAGAGARTLITASSIGALGFVVAASILTVDYHQPWLYQGGLAAVAIAAGFFVATLCLPANALTRPLAWKPFRVVGEVSYAMFLLHLPVFWILQHALGHDTPPLVLFAGGGLITWLAAIVLHHVITEPLRRATWRPKSAILAIVISVAMVIGAAWWLPIDRAAHPTASTSTGAAGAGAGGAFAVDGPITVPTGHAGGPVTVAVVGDSVASNLYEALAEHGGQRISAIDVTTGGCGIFDADSARSGEGYVMDTRGLCWPWKDKLKAANEPHSPDVYVLHNLWDANDQLIDGAWVGPCTAKWQSRYTSQLELLISIGNGSGHQPQILLSNDRPRAADGPLSRTRLDCVNSVAGKIAEKHDNVHLLDLESAVCPDGRCVWNDDQGRPLFTDAAHFSEDGRAVMYPWLENKIAHALTAPVDRS
jgi:peptidoglycan/LPS O-acetylase OafA/YrhL